MEANRKCKVVMLPAKGLSKILKHSDGVLTYHPKEQKEYLLHGWIPQHLYILSDDKIKEGDWCIHLGLNRVEQWDNNPELDISLRRKVIATTDKSLEVVFIEQRYGIEYGGFRKLPTPSQAFIEKYCKLGGIDEVDVEYFINKHITIPSGKYWEDEPVERKAYLDKPDEYPKVNSHNEITIHPIKDSWTREEVIELIRKSHNDAILNFDGALDVDAWINQNL